jgi:hypothetical protein
MNELNYLIAISVFPIGAIIATGILVLIVRREDRRSHRHTPAE